MALTFYQTLIASAGDPTSAPASLNLPKPRKVDPLKAELPEILTDLESGDPRKIVAATTRLHNIASTNKGAHEKPVQILLQAKRYDDAQQFAVDFVLQNPSDTRAVAAVEKARAQAFLAQRNYLGALGAAHSYYNIATLKDSSDAINLITLALVLGKPNDPVIAKRFKQQQIAWARAAPATQPTTANPDSAAPTPVLASATSQPSDSLGDPILPAIAADSKPFEAAAEAIEPTDYNEFVGKGNLLLLVGHASEAHAAFERAEAIAPDNHEAEAIENIARAIRAESGCVGPANAYILQLRNEQQ